MELPLMWCYDINVGTGSSSPSNLTVSGGKLYFSASDGTAAGLHGTELWATDGYHDCYGGGHKPGHS